MGSLLGGGGGGIFMPISPYPLKVRSPVWGLGAGYVSTVRGTYINVPISTEGSDMATTSPNTDFPVRGVGAGYVSTVGWGGGTYTNVPISTEGSDMPTTSPGCRGRTFFYYFVCSM